MRYFFTIFLRMPLKSTLCAFLLFTLFSCGQIPENRAQNSYSSSASTFSVVNWNIEWFGSDREGPYDKDLQQENASKILKYLAADIYGLCEIVDTARLGEMVRTLPASYQYVISDYAAHAKNNRGKSWSEGQKLAFVFNPAVFHHVRVRPFLSKSKQARYNFSNGRLPFLLEADVVKNNKMLSIAFLLLHAKSGADAESATRRMLAANEMADSIQVEFAHKPLIIMGDFNDILNGSIAENSSIIPYQAFANANFKALTLPLTQKGGRSTLHYNNIIDQQIINQSFLPYYIAGSTRICMDVVNAVPNFKKGNTSDHYPVISQFHCP